MSEALFRFVRRHPPRVGWLPALLALGAALMPSLAASSSPLRLPRDLFVWAGALGLLLGLSAYEERRPQRRLARAAIAVGAALCLCAALLAAAGRALPPAGLVFQDAAALSGWIGRGLDPAVPAGPPPELGSGLFLTASLPRFWQTLLAAPGAGEAGARLLIAVGGLITGLAGAFALGWALAARRPSALWSIPLVGAIAFTAILGGAHGGVLVIGVGLVLLLGIVTGFQRRRLGWEQAGIDFSDEIGVDVVAWGAMTVLVVLVVALVVPTSLDNPLARLLWRDVELPSGVEAIQRQVQRRPTPAPQVNPGLSTLPAVQLGVSLEQGPPESVALLVRATPALPPGPWPRYWRARVLNLYNGQAWWSNAQKTSVAAATVPDEPPPDTVVQEIEDRRPRRQTIAALPDVVSVDVAADVERLPDGSLAALTADPPDRYRVLSKLPELAQPQPPDAPPPDLSAELALPRNLPPRVADLARAVAGGDERPIDRALSLESYLRQLPYSYEVRPLPQRGDAVDQFLFEMREGYCTYYASAMAVMARTLDIPARVATGYATGTYDEATGAYIVREADAHAWPELLIDGRWTPFEPTPIRPLPQRSGAAPAPGPAPQPAPPERRPAWPLAVAVAAGAALAIGAWLARRGRRREPASLVERTQLRLELAGARAGVAWPSGATLHEYGELLRPHVDGAAEALRELIELLERARYGGRALRGDEEASLRSAGERVWQALQGDRGRS